MDSVYVYIFYILYIYREREREREGERGRGQEIGVGARAIAGTRILPGLTRRGHRYILSSLAIPRMRGERYTGP